MLAFMYTLERLRRDPANIFDGSANTCLTAHILPALICMTHKHLGNMETSACIYITVGSICLAQALAMVHVLSSMWKRQQTTVKIMAC